MRHQTLLFLAVTCVVLPYLLIAINNNINTTVHLPPPVLQPKPAPIPINQLHGLAQSHDNATIELSAVSTSAITKEIEEDNAVNSLSSSELSRYYKIQNLLNGYAKKLSQMRAQALEHNSNNTADWSVLARETIRVTDKKFAELDFDHLEIRAPNAYVSQLYTNNYFRYSSNNCRRSPITGRLRVSCTGNASSTVDVAMTSNDKSFTKQLPGRHKDHKEPTQLLTYITVVRKGIINSEGDVFSAGHRIISARCITSDQRISAANISVKDTDMAYYPEVFSAHQRYGDQIYHGTIEVLQRIAPYMEFLQRHPDIKIHLLFDNPVVQLLGIDRSRVIVDRFVKADVVYVPQGGGCCGPPLFPVQLLSLQLKSNINSQTNQDTIVLIKRGRNTKKRYFEAHDDIVKILSNGAARFGLRVAVFQDNPLPTFEEQVAMFSRALVIIGPHGAGLCNAILSRPGTLVIEGSAQWGGHAKTCFINLAESLGLRYYGLYSEDVTSVSASEIERPLLDFLTKWKEN